jgi:hypothetical protein
MFTVAAAPFRIPNALIMGGGIRSWGWLIRKFSSERSVCAPQYLSAGTWTSPNASVSALVFAAILVALPWKYLWCCIEGIVRGVAIEEIGALDGLGEPFRHVLSDLTAVLGIPRLPRAAGPAMRIVRSMLKVA